MSAARVAGMPGPWQPDPVRQRQAGYRLEDLLRLPPDAPRVELVDGVIHVVPAPTLGHQDVSSLLRGWLGDHAPAHLRAAQAVGVALDRDFTREPDVLVYRAEVPDDRHFLLPHEVVLAVEVVSPGTRRTDRFSKPAEYAGAGIAGYWRVEQNPVRVYAYRLADRPGRSGNREYELLAEADELLELTQPFPVELPITEITP
ncbi:Uma2 family endonuclease [Micromonospora sp. WMMD1102]|uniref:Uma2 family endonuclease n=1 Tax=Micromonospora sp. WMMD1102 TaxID=3016105 RepID=UPI002414F9FE|nr:Uma2 family endonuclease [Micromonospora sp. WMMD1102]MDG4788606.1 Uma2 family endonuclease [Micromonospora sp. WMMD1102]